MSETDTSAANRIAPIGRSRRRAGDVPEALAARYLIERDAVGRKVAFYRDHRETTPRFMDTGRSLSTLNAYPDAVCDMLLVAAHRGWNRIHVRGDEAFRREVWIQARDLGLDVKGHRPSTRDRQAIAAPPERQALQGKATRRRLDEIAVIVRTLVPDASLRDRLLERARERLAGRRDPDRDRWPERSR